MEREPSVQIREACEACDGTGKQRVEAGAGHVTLGEADPVPGVRRHRPAGAMDRTVRAPGPARAA